MTENTHLIISYPENIPQEIVDIEISELNPNNIFSVKIVRQKNELYAAFEWIVPTFLATYILKPYFESFLSEAGKDHYKYLKEFSRKMLTRGKKTEAKLIAATQSTQKLSSNYTQSLAVSIGAEMVTRRKVKLLFDNNLELIDWENALEEFISYMLDHYENFPNDRFSNEVKKLSPKHYATIYGIINPLTKKIEFHDDETLFTLTKK